VDQLESTTPGLIAQLKGTPTKLRYRYVTVFVDHYSGLSFVYLQKTITSEETVEAKRAFEAYAKTLNVQIRHYHADNGRFADNLFIKAVKEAGQTISFCGVNAHFQNGRAEKRIRDLQDSARTQLIHAKHRWPKAIETCLWPYAMRYANVVHNSTTQRDGRPSPLELFSKVPVKPKIKHCHPFGCPCFVLDNKLQASKALPKWNDRARLGIYLGPSPRHARSVALVLSLTTGLVSPQYHVKFDNLFETLNSQRLPKSQWQEKCHFRESDKRNWNHLLSGRSKTKAKSTAPPVEEPSPDIPPQLEVEPEPPPDASEETPANEGDSRNEGEQPAAPPQEVQQPPAAANQQPTYRTRSGRESKFPHKHYSGFVTYRVEFEVLDPSLYIEEDIMSELDNPVTFKATSDPDTMYMQEALKQPDAKKFKEAMVKEVNDHTEREHWKPILKSDVPDDYVILPAVWSMKRKRRIATREVYKWKARLNLGGHKMIYGRDYDETYAPALSWTTIRLFLTLSILRKWHSRQIDFVLAYPQADIPKRTFMELPRGINFPGLERNKWCLEVTKNIYGGKNSGRTWYLHLRKGLKDLGFDPSEQDECVFYRGTTILLVYTDDCILIDKESEANIDKAIADLNTIFDVEDEGTLEDYLGVQVKHRKDGTIYLSQPHLIDSILQDLGFLDERGSLRERKTSTRATPAQTTRLIGPDPEGKPFTHDWNYRSVIGKLNFLEKSTRPDIAYAVHQCARFMSNPKESHGHAIKHLGRYLLGTRDKGLLLNPDNDKSFECYVDADFSGNWDKRIAAEDPNTAKYNRQTFSQKHAIKPRSNVIAKQSWDGKPTSCADRERECGITVPP
jgi:hypothetical protein